MQKCCNRVIIKDPINQTSNASLNYSVKSYCQNYDALCTVLLVDGLIRLPTCIV